MIYVLKASEDFNPPCSCTFSAVLVATLQENRRKKKSSGKFDRFRTQLLVRASGEKTDPVPSECPHRQTNPPLLWLLAHWYR